MNERAGPQQVDLPILLSFHSANLHWTSCCPDQVHWRPYINGRRRRERRVEGSDKAGRRSREEEGGGVEGSDKAGRSREEEGEGEKGGGEREGGVEE